MKTTKILRLNYGNPVKVLVNKYSWPLLRNPQSAELARTASNQPSCSNYNQLLLTNYNRLLLTNYNQLLLTNYNQLLLTNYNQLLLSNYNQLLLTNYNQLPLTNYNQLLLTNYNQLLLTIYNQLLPNYNGQGCGDPPGFLWLAEQALNKRLIVQRSKHTLKTCSADRHLPQSALYGAWRRACWWEWNHQLGPVGEFWSLTHTRHLLLNISLFSCTQTASTLCSSLSGTLTVWPSTSTERWSGRTLSSSGEINATVTVTIVAIVAIVIRHGNLISCSLALGEPAIQVPWMLLNRLLDLAPMDPRPSQNTSCLRNGLKS